MDEVQQLRLTVRTAELPDGSTVVAAAGECDLYEAKRLEAALIHEAGASAHMVFLELSELSFLDSTGLHALLKAQRLLEEKGSQLVLVAPGEVVRRTLAVAGLEGRFPIRDALGVEANGRATSPGELDVPSPADSIFRAVNERILAISSSWVADDEVHFFCECRDDGCTKPVTMAREAFERVRAAPGCLVLHPAHVPVDGWHVVEATDVYVVVSAALSAGSRADREATGV